MNIKIDSRERGLVEQVKSFIAMLPIYKDISVTIETLALGDIILEYNGDEKLIIERKTIRDLGSSIKDGRYEEQSYRLNGLQIPNHNILYLIEGDINKINKFVDKTDKLTIFSAIFSLNYYKGFSVIRTMNIEETALFICNCASKLRKNNDDNKSPYYNNNTQVLGEVSQQEKDYVDVIKKIKKENITPQNIDEIMLCQIPGVSSTTAIAVISEYKSIYNLTKYIEVNGIDNLKNLTYTTSKNLKRKINKTSIENIQKFLLKI